MAKIVMVIDDPKWAFSISAQDMVKNMPNFDFKIINYYDKPELPEHYEGADLIYLFGHYMIDWLPKGFDMSKVCTGVRALFGYMDDQMKSTQDIWTSDKAQDILKFPMIHTVSKESYDIFKEFHPNVSYVCHGVDTDFFTQKTDYKKHSPFVLGWAGNPGNKVKGIDLVRKALSNGRTDTVLKTAEFGEKQLNREELREFYHSLDAFVLPSVSEGCSAALLEAMACGLPIIATDTGTWLEFKNLGGGFSMERNDKSFNEALNKLISLSEDELREMGNKNRQEMFKWDWKVKTKEFEEFFNKALKHEVTGEKTIKCFEEKWKMMPPGYGFKDFKQVEFFVNWALEKYGFKTVDQLNKFYKGKENVLEVGFGSGFNLQYIMSKSKAKLTGVDTSSTACAELKNFVQDKIDIHNVDLMKFETEKPFDLIIADGVLHHLPDTKGAIKHLYSMLAEGGDMYVYLYRKTGRIREFTNDYLRMKMRALPPEECAKQCEDITKFAKSLSSITKKIRVGNVPLLGLKPGNYTPHEIFYYGVMKAFWNDAFSFEENNLNNYDWFYPEIAQRFSEEEVSEWMKELGCKFKFNSSNPNGIHLLMSK